MEEHQEHVRQVLNTLRTHQLYANSKKSEFGLTETEYVGHRISAEGLKVDPKKTRDVQEWPRHTTVTAVRRFIGMASYYRRLSVTSHI
jgi:hypothetical protein